ncbi:hypothetical protein TNCV_3544431 [Trichonephila clavipes]|nr:hypothetical protein TNCV_3544431 [Trichonephila clavipes]
MQAQGGPVRSRGERFQKPSPSCRQESRHPSRQEQEPRSSRFSCQSPRQDRNSRQKECQQMSGTPASGSTASLHVLVGDVLID